MGAFLSNQSKNFRAIPCKGKKKFTRNFREIYETILQEANKMEVQNTETVQSRYVPSSERQWIVISYEAKKNINLWHWIGDGKIN